MDFKKKIVEHENKLNQLEEEKVQLRNEMVQKTNMIVFHLDRQEQYIRRENILVYGVEDNEDNDDGEKVLFKIADELEIDLQDNDIQRVHRLGQNCKKQGESPSNHCKICVIQKKETSFILTKGISKITKEDSTSLFVRISHLCGTSY